MKISSIGPYAYRNVGVAEVKKTQVADRNNDVQKYSLITFCGNPSKKSHQIAAYAVESNFLGSTYKEGGLGDVAEALPDAIAKYGHEATKDGKPLDIRTFLPYYSFDNSQGKLYVVSKYDKEEEAKDETGKAIKKTVTVDLAEEIKNNASYSFSYKSEEKDDMGNNKIDNKHGVQVVDYNYELKPGESFILATEGKGNNIARSFVLKDIGIQGTVKRAVNNATGFEMEEVPYRVFELEIPKYTKGNTPADRQDKMYIIYTPELAKGKRAYGVYKNYTNDPGKPTSYGGGSADMYYTEQNRAMEEALEKMSTWEGDKKFNPQNILLHDRFSYAFISDALQKAKKGNDFYKGLRFVPVYHNIGRAYQGYQNDPMDFFRVVATEDDMDKLRSNEKFQTVQSLYTKLNKETKGISSDERKQLFEFFKGYFPNLVDKQNTFNMTMITTAPLKGDGLDSNHRPGCVSKNFGKESRDPKTSDISTGLTEELKRVEKAMIDVVNGERAANMKTDKQDEGFGRDNELTKILTDTSNPRHYTPYTLKDNLTDAELDVIFNAKKKNKENLINILAEATEKLGSDKDAIAKIFFNDTKREDLRKINDTETLEGLDLTLGGMSKYEEGDLLFTTWGRPNEQKGYPITLQAFKDILKDTTIPIAKRKHLKLIMGAGTGGNDAFGKSNTDNTEWEKIKKEIKEISELEGGAFKNNVVYVNGMFPNRIANCVDMAIFTSRFEPCGITPFESYAAGTPVISIGTGGAPDFIKEGGEDATGFLTKDPFFLKREGLGLKEDEKEDTLDGKRIEHSANQIAEKIKEYISPIKGDDCTDYTDFDIKQKQYIKNCASQKIEWNNNRAYNEGRSGLEVYVQDKFATDDDAKPGDNAYVSTEITDDLRGEFNAEAIKKNTGKKIAVAAGIGGLIGLIAAGIALVKSKLSKKKAKPKDDIDEE